jgi:hypothetical protein
MQVWHQVKFWLNKPEVKAGILIFLMALLIFGIGYLLGRDWTVAPIIIEKAGN